MHWLAISGSLRAISSNGALLRAAIQLAPANVKISLYDGLSTLPHYNPDLEEALPSAAAELRAIIESVDGLLISSPEYAFGVPGSLKNALDWLVGGHEFVGKPIALFNASPRATTARDSLIRTLTAMAGRIITEASITLPLLGRNLSAAAIEQDPELSAALRAALEAFQTAIERSPREAL
jgi:chromate reductase, NAD(P)H dehydrogenase (quinone)